MPPRFVPVLGLALALGVAFPAGATVTIVSMTPSVVSPQPLGTAITWTVTATNSNPDPLEFQFNVAPSLKSFTLAQDYNIGTAASGNWVSQPFVWSTIGGEGIYAIQVIVKDFVSGESAEQTAVYSLTPLATTKSVVSRSSNPLVALFSTPPCATGNSIRVAFYTGSNPLVYTDWASCNPNVSSNFYIVGMLPSTVYTMYSQVLNGSTITNGNAHNFETGKLPTKLPYSGKLPALTVALPAQPNSGTAYPVILWGFTNDVVPAATDLSGNIIWYYSQGVNPVLTRPIAGGSILLFENGPTWSSANLTSQYLQQIDLAGNIQRQTNTGILANELTAMGAQDGASCVGVPNPAPVGTACLNGLSHDAIRFTINNSEYTALLAYIERVYPAGTQGTDPNGPPVDIVGDMLIVLNSEWQVVWYWDAFEQLDVNQPAVLGETCGNGATGSDCRTNLLLASTAQDWTHANTVYYMAGTGDFLISLRDLDWLVKVNFNNLAGSGNVLWKMGPENGNFTFVNRYNDPWPWFSHQHDANYANNGSGPLTIFDNGNTRISPPPLGLGTTACEPNDCDSRGMAVNVSESTLQVDPVLSVSLRYYADAVGAAQLLADGIYFFQLGTPNSDAVEILPTAGTDQGVQVLNIKSSSHSYRAWQMPNLWSPPTNY